MRKTILVLVAALAAGCEGSPQLVEHTVQPPAESDRVVIVLMGMNQVNWNGWLTSAQTLPELVQRDHIKSAVIRGRRGTAIPYGEALQVEEILKKAGVENVEIGSGGLVGE